MLTQLPNNSANRRQSDYLTFQVNNDQSSTTLLDSSDDSNDAGKRFSDTENISLFTKWI